MTSDINAIKIHAFRIKENEDALNALSKYLEEKNIRAGLISGIGAMKEIHVGFFEDGEYVTIKKSGIFEVGSLQGNISIKDGKPFLHAHLIVGDSSGKTYAGHLMEGNIVHPTLEVIILEFTGLQIDRVFYENLNLFTFKNTYFPKK